jgi:hypothetical protein
VWNTVGWGKIKDKMMGKRDIIYHLLNIATISFGTKPGTSPTAQT